MQHVHNWKLKITNFDTNLSQNEQGWYGFYAERIWECIRGGKVKHIMPSKEYAAATYDFDNHPQHLESKVFLALSGSPYISDEERGW